MKVVNFTHPFYLISDTHFHHSRLAFDFGLRTQFKSIKEMNELIISNWNKTVSEDGYIFFLGDFVIGAENKYKTAQIIYDGLKGRKIFLKGNHDEHLKKFTNIPVIDGSLGVIYKEKSILLSHEPIWDFEQDIAIHGHVHNQLPLHHRKNMFNVSCESINFTPVFIDDLIEMYCFS